MKSIHVISHTHWDREWYQTFQQFRLRLVHLVDGLLNILDNDQEFKFFMLDGQTTVLEDYLQVRPDREEELRKYIQRGRILIGPWHILPDDFLVGGEAHIRNLRQGDRSGQKFGPKMQIGYLPDSFGHIGQMPQILRGFGFETSCLWRGVDDQPAEFWWQAPDGSRVFMAFLRESYSNGAWLPVSDNARFAAELKTSADLLAPHTTSAQVLVMLGTDHMEPSPNTSAAIQYANELLMLNNDAHVLHSTLPNFLEKVRAEVDPAQMPVVSGELRGSKRSHLLPGVLSTRIWIKQRNQASQTLLEKWAEPFSVFAELARADGAATPTRISQPASILRQTWKLLMENHPHDSICGCSIDQVHDEMKVRFDQVDQVGEEITKQSLEALAQAIHTRHAGEGQLASVIIFNPSSTPRSGQATTDISLPADVQAFELIDENGEPVPFESLGSESAEIANLLLDRKGLRESLSMVNEGRITGLGVQAFTTSREGDAAHIELALSEAEPVESVWKTGVDQTTALLQDESIQNFHIRIRSLPASRIKLLAAHVPALGWRTFSVWPVEKPASTPTRLNPLASALMPLARTRLGQKLINRSESEGPSKPPYIIENEFFIVEALNDGSLTLTDKRDGNVFSGLNRFVDVGDRGDEYNFCPVEFESHAHKPALKIWGVKVRPGSVSSSIELAMEMSVPEGLSEDRRDRSDVLAPLYIVTTATLTAGLPQLEIHTAVENNARDHRLRVHFPAGLGCDQADFDGHFHVVQRPLDLAESDQSWAEQPRPETHQGAFTDVSDGTRGMMVANRGLPEVEVLRAKDGSAEIVLTLLRCVGWLSRDDMSTRKGHAGPALETPGAQMPGNWEFDYAVIPHVEGQRQPYHQAYAFGAPLRALSVSPHTGNLPASASFVEVEPAEFIISAIKTSEDGNGWIMRGFNISGQEVDVNLKLLKNATSASIASLAEVPQSKLEISGGNEVGFKAGPHQIVTLLFH